jgi:hypothetical protein
MVRPTETGVNRSSGQQDVPSEQEHGDILTFAARALVIGSIALSNYAVSPGGCTLLLREGLILWMASIAAP